MKIICNLNATNLECLADIENANIYQFAFYLKRNGEKIETKWYSPENKILFNLKETGNYTVVAFAKNGENAPIISESEKLIFIYEQNLVNVSIFGSCVSRDILETPNYHFINLKSYIARQSIVSAVSPCVECNIDDINLPSTFQKKMIYSDFTKDVFDKLKTDNSDYLIIDLIDERFKLAKHKNSIVTYSNELITSGYIQSPKFINDEKLLNPSKFIFFPDTTANNGIKRYIDEFVEDLLNIYPAKNIIIHRATMLDYYKNTNRDIIHFPKNQLKSNKEINAKINFMYDYLIYKLPNCKVIDLCDSFTADETNKWGLAPMHYESDYYTEVIRELYKLIKDTTNE